MCAEILMWRDEPETSTFGRFLRIGITGIQFAGSATAGINIIRSLLESSNINAELMALSNYPLSCALGMWPSIRKAYLVPSPAQGPRPMLKRFREIVSQKPLHLLMPCNDEEVLILSKIQAELRDLGIQTLLPSAETVLSVMKDSLYETASRLSLPVAKTWTAKSMTTISRNSDYPVVVKGALCDAYLAGNAKEASVYFRKIRGIWGLPVIFQEFVDGDEYAIVAIADRSSRMVGAVAIRKIGITEKGKTWCGCAINDPALLSLASDTIDKLGWVGPMEIEVVRDRVSGEYRIIEINPRFPTWIYLATAAGQNLPEALVRIALGQAVERLSAYKTGIMFTRVCGYRTYPITLIGQLVTEGVAALDSGSREQHRTHKRKSSSAKV